MKRAGEDGAGCCEVPAPTRLLSCGTQASALLSALPDVPRGAPETAMLPLREHLRQDEITLPPLQARARGTQARAAL